MTSLAIVLAAGFSKRFGSDKRLAGSKPMLLTTLEKLMPAFDQSLLVLRYQDKQVLSLIQSYDLQTVFAPASPIGQGESIATAAKKIIKYPQEYEGVTRIAICLADMPYIETLTYQQLMVSSKENNIVRPYYNNQAGQPVIFGINFLKALATCQGDIGAREIIKKNHKNLVRVDVNDPGVLLDIDTEKNLP